MNGRRSRQARRTMALALTAKPAAIGLLAISPRVASADATIPAACTAGVGDVVSLRAAITAANGNTGTTTITLGSACTYTLTGPDANNAGDGLEPISKTVVIEGRGSTITRSTANATPQFRIAEVASQGDLTIHNLTVSNGLAANNAGGGGIYSQGALSVLNSTISGNQATSSGRFIDPRGGGLSTRGTLNVLDSVISGNQVSSTPAGPTGGGSARGGGIFAKGGRVTIRRTTIANNGVTAAGAGGVITRTAGGGGIAIESGTTTGTIPVSIIASTLSGNTAAATNGTSGTADASGGALAVSDTLDTDPVNLTMVNDTVAGNTVTGDSSSTGGAISLKARSADAFRVVNTTVASNSSATGALEAGGGTVSVVNTLLANNAGGNCQGTITDQGHNISYPSPETSTTCTSFGHGNPNLGQLSGTAGMPRTLPLQNGSAAIDAGDPAICAAAEPGGAAGVDERGLSRTEGAASDSACDVGAFEVQPQPVVAVVAAVPSPSPTPGLPPAGTTPPDNGAGVPWALVIPVATAALAEGGRHRKGLLSRLSAWV